MPQTSSVMRQRPRKDLSQDLRAGVIVYLVALPLCLGIATASGAPPLAGLIAGIVGGTVVAMASSSPLSVAGPAAGLTVIVLEGIEQLGLRTFFTATLLGGALQMLMGVLRLGRVAQIVPNAVIRGMLAAIGLILVLKQLPHAVGYDRDPEGDFSFAQPDGHNTFSELMYSLESITLGAVIVTACAALAMWLWRDYPRLNLRKFVPRELVAVLVGLAVGLGLESSSLGLQPEHRVSLPVLESVTNLPRLWTSPDLAGLMSWTVWKTALTIAIVASIESLLCVEATDRLDPLKRVTSPDRELIAQGAGNLVSGGLGGLPVTAVVVRSFANVNAGGTSKASSVIHGVLLAASVLLLGHLLNHIPLAALAVVLIVVGYKLTAPQIYVQLWRMGSEQFLPFITTVLSILLTDLLIGTALGFVFSVFFVIVSHYRGAIVVTDDGGNRLIRFSSNVSFLHKAKLRGALEGAPAGSNIILDGTRVKSVDPDVLETIRSFEERAASLGVTLEVRRSRSSVHHYFRDEATA